MNTAIHKTIGYIDTPILSQPILDQRLNGNAAMQFDLVALQQLSPEQLSKQVCIVQDPSPAFKMHKLWSLGDTDHQTRL